ncbi:MAG: translation elongation factor Ts [Deltaproteobacteria bacterium]|nr:translation elongation factor Ts [Deltaproteobacteria bacterium]
MSDISAATVKALRDKTGAGMMDCKKAIKEAGGDMEKAIEVLRKMGLKDIGKRAGKVAAEGVIGTYVHPGDQVAVLLELNCETDFVARGAEFREVAKGLAMQVAAMNPLYLSEADVPPAVLEKEKEIILETLNEKQKAMADKIIPGKLQKFYEEHVLLHQKYVRDDSEKKSVKDVVEELSAKVGEKITVRRFQRFEVGEGLEKKDANLVSDIAEVLEGN